MAPAAANAAATAKLDFKITVPRVLYLRIGTGTNLADNATVNLLDFTVPATSVGNGTPVAASAASGDLGNGSVTVRVLGNGGTITLNSFTTGPLTTGTTGEIINWDRITVTSAALPVTTPNFNNSAIPHPTFMNSPAGGYGWSNNLTATNNVVRRECQWTYAYANTDVVAAGTYGGVNANNGRVSYTVTMP